MKKNDHSVSIPQQELEVIKSNLRTVLAALLLYAKVLTAQERHDFPKMGEKTLSFVEKALELATEYPELCPDFVNIEEFKIDFADATGLRTLKNTADQVSQIIDDIILLAGSEAYQSALSFYSYVRLLTDRNVPQAKTVYEELKKRFPKNARNSKKDEE
jgi:hypothetical protein